MIFESQLLNFYFNSVDFIGKSYLYKKDSNLNVSGLYSRDIFKLPG